MENKVVILDTSVLIDYFRKKDKEKTFFVHLTNKFLESCISSIAEFEIYVGATSTQLAFWKSILQEMNVLPFDSKAAHEAVSILHQLSGVAARSLYIYNLDCQGEGAGANVPSAIFCPV